MVGFIFTCVVLFFVHLFLNERFVKNVLELSKTYITEEQHKNAESKFLPFDKCKNKWFEPVSLTSAIITFTIFWPILLMFVFSMVFLFIYMEIVN